MGRPSVKAQRSEEILAAFRQCVCKYGIEGATLEKIAEESGLARPLIRHHMGNREDLIQSLFDRFLDEAYRMIDELTADLPDNQGMTVLLQRLFDDWNSDFELVLLAEAFIGSSSTNSDMAEKLGSWVNDYTRSIARELHKEYPDSSMTDIDTVATGILALFFNANSLEPLKSIRKLRPYSKQASDILINSLK